MDLMEDGRLNNYQADIYICAGLSMYENKQETGIFAYLEQSTITDNTQVQGFLLEYQLFLNCMQKEIL